MIIDVDRDVKPQSNNIKLLGKYMYSDMLLTDDQDRRWEKLLLYIN